jgi:signal transduction histidine kinase
MTVPGTDALLARIADLERQTRRTFEDAQREADAMFAQYQLSQLLTSGAALDDLATAVLVEVVRLCDAAGGALWLTGPGSMPLHLAASLGTPPSIDPPAGDMDLAAARAWSAALPLGTILELGEGPDSELLALWGDPLDPRPLDPEGLRVVQLSRHELAVAFRSAQLRETLERERHELTAIVNGATDSIVQVDEGCHVVRINAAAARLLGSAPEAVLGRRCGKVLGCAAAGGHGEDACPLAEVIRTGNPIAYRETAVLGEQGVVARVAGGYYRAAGGPGGALRATAILRDISAVQALEELREGFVATVSHELRTPLALIRGYAETLLHLELDVAQQRGYVERIQQTTERLTGLVTEILDITHLEADPLILERTPVALGSLLARLRGDLAITHPSARLEIETPQDLPPLEVDAGRVGQVLENVAANALKYSPPGSPITIRAAIDGEWCLVTVDDEGLGVPADDRALVMEPFHRARNVRESAIPGTGLGLYICRRLVEAHGGRMWLTDRADGQAGTRVAFTLPLLRGGRRRAGGSSPAATPVPVAGESGPGGGGRG